MKLKFRQEYVETYIST